MVEMSGGVFLPFIVAYLPVDDQHKVLSTTDAYAVNHISVMTLPMALAAPLPLYDFFIRGLSAKSNSKAALHFFVIALRFPDLLKQWAYL